MKEQKELFLRGASSRGFDEGKAGELFELMAYFAGYGFNKSHSAAYGLIAYQTAYLKANYPAEFMACLLSLEASNAEKMAFYLQETKEMGITITPPHINTSAIGFTASHGTILFGLEGIKNVGKAPLDNIVSVRAQKPFVDLLDFCSRIDLRTSNKRVIEHLICAGAFDTFSGHRAQQYHELSKVMDLASEQKKLLQTGQMGLFGSRSPNSEKNHNTLYHYEALTPWSDKERLAKELAVIGFYLSSHPLEPYKNYISWLKPSPIAHLVGEITRYAQTEEPYALVCGLLKGKKEIVTKKGDRMAFIQLEDMSSVCAEIILFPKIFNKIEQWLSGEYQVFLIKGTVDTTTTQKCKIKAEECIPLDLVLEKWPTIQAIRISLSSALSTNTIDNINFSLVPGQTPVEILFTENGKRLILSSKRKVKIDLNILEKLASFGAACEIILY